MEYCNTRFLVSQSMLIRGVDSLQRCTYVFQWTPSNLATLGSSQSVLIRGVASFRLS